MGGTTTITTILILLILTLRLRWLMMMTIIIITMTVGECNRKEMPRQSPPPPPITTLPKQLYHPNDVCNGRAIYHHYSPFINNLGRFKFRSRIMVRSIKVCNSGSVDNERSICSSRRDGRVGWIRNK